MIRPTPKQIQIRDHPELNLRVIAPAGCGKTEALALRVRGLLDRGAILAPRKVLVTTFSNRARENIHERLGSYLTPSQLRDRVTVMNFHGLSTRIFRAHASVIDLEPEMSIPEDDWVGKQPIFMRISRTQRSKVQEIFRSIKQQPFINDEDVMRLLNECNVDDTLKKLRSILKGYALNRISSPMTTFPGLPN